LHAMIRADVSTEFRSADTAVDAWEPCDTNALIDGGAEATADPNSLYRDDETPLLYGNKVNWTWGRPGSGKTILHLLENAQHIRAAHHVIWVDLEHQAVEHARNLMNLFHLPREYVAFYFHVIQPKGALSPANRVTLDKLLSNGAALLTLDACNGLIALNGGRANDDDAIYQIELELLDQAVAFGCGVRVIDHVTKNQESNDWPKNSGRKRDAAWTGVRLRSVVPFSRDQDGYGELTCFKDRSGTWTEGDSLGYLVMQEGRCFVSDAVPSLSLMAARGAPENVAVTAHQLVENDEFPSIRALAAEIFKYHGGRFGSEATLNRHLKRYVQKKNKILVWCENSDESSL